MKYNISVCAIAWEMMSHFQSSQPSRYIHARPSSLPSFFKNSFFCISSYFYDLSDMADEYIE